MVPLHQRLPAARRLSAPWRRPAPVATRQPDCTGHQSRPRRQSVDTLTAEALQDTSRWFLRDATIKAANTILVDHHHGLKLSRIWGDGSRSSSDGQRFALERDRLLGSVYPRYFGYYDR